MCMMFIQYISKAPYLSPYMFTGEKREYASGPAAIWIWKTPTASTARTGNRSAINKSVWDLKYFI